MTKRTLSFVLAALILIPLKGLAITNAVPFAIPGDDASSTVIDASTLNPTPIDESRRLVARNGHFYDGTGRRVRLLAVNLNTGALFMTPTQDEKMVAHLHKMGVNMVRIHHMDSEVTPSGIWAPSKPPFQNFDPAQVNKLDYLLSCFRKYGVYVDLCLHTSFSFDNTVGFAGVPTNDPSAIKGVTYFVPAIRSMEKKYAQMLLAHTNAYTGETYAQDPVIAMIETNNEDTMWTALDSDGTSPTNPHYPALFETSLQKLWNAWLKKRYGTTSRLARAWNALPRHQSPNLLSNPTFGSGTMDSWRIQITSDAAATSDLETGDLPAAISGYALHVHVSRAGAAAWHVQLLQTGLTVQNGSTYTIGAWLKTDSTDTIGASMLIDQNPYTTIGRATSFRADAGWVYHQWAMVASNSLPGHDRVNFTVGQRVGDVWLTGLSLRPGNQTALPSGVTLEAANLPVPYQPQGAQRVDAMHFVVDTESAHANDLRLYLRHSLHSQALITCSQIHYGQYLGVLREAQSDYTDAHAYWHHPQFLGRPWDPIDWVIDNSSMISGAPSATTLPAMAFYHVEGKPFVVSEYNEPAPNDFSSETIPELFSYAVLQDWDGVFLFDYAGNPTVAFSNQINNFFSIQGHPGKSAYYPLAAQLFLRPSAWAPEPAVLRLPTSNPYPAASNQLNVISYWGMNGIQPLDALNAPILLHPDASAAAISISGRVTPSNYFQWISSGPSSVCLTHFPASVSLVGCLGGRTITSGPVTVRMPSTPNNFMSVMVGSLDGKPVPDAQSLLLTTLGDVENLNMGWNATRTSVGNRWGTGPVQIEATVATMILRTNATQAQVFALTPTGARRVPVPSTLHDGTLTFSIGPQYKTPWYEMALSGQMARVILTGPANEAHFTAPATLALAATATDSQGTIAHVDFYQNDVLIGSAGAAPFAYRWASVPTGSYVITAKAVTSNGAVTTSTPVSVRVSAAAEAVSKP